MNKTDFSLHTSQENAGIAGEAASETSNCSCGGRLSAAANTAAATTAAKRHAAVAVGRNLCAA